MHHVQDRYKYYFVEYLMQYLYISIKLECCRKHVYMAVCINAFFPWPYFAVYVFLDYGGSRPDYAAALAYACDSQNWTDKFTLGNAPDPALGPHGLVWKENRFVTEWLTWTLDIKMHLSWDATILWPMVWSSHSSLLCECAFAFYVLEWNRLTIILAPWK